MRYRIKKPRTSIVVRINGNTRTDEATLARRARAAMLRHPNERVILYLSNWYKNTTPQLGFLEAIHQEVTMRGGVLRLCGFRDDLLVQFDYPPHSSRSGQAEWSLKRSA